MREYCRTVIQSRRALLRHPARVLEMVLEMELVLVSVLAKVMVLDQAVVVTSAVGTSTPVVADRAVAAVVTTPRSLLEEKSLRKHVSFRSLSPSTLKTRARTRSREQSC